MNIQKLKIFIGKSHNLDQLDSLQEFLKNCIPKCSFWEYAYAIKPEIIKIVDLLDTEKIDMNSIRKIKDKLSEDINRYESMPSLDEMLTEARARRGS